MKPLAFAITLLTTVALPNTLFADNGSTVRSPLTNTGVDSDARGSVFSLLKSKASLVTVKVDGLTPKAEYSLKVGDLTEAEFKADKQGRARLRFRTGSGKTSRALDFDPRGKTLSVVDGNGSAVLEAVISGEAEPPQITVDERANLATQNGTKGKAGARYVAKKNGQRSFNVKVTGTKESSLQLYVAGVHRGEVPIQGKAGRIEFSTEPKPGALTLDFDPRSAQVELFTADDTLVFGGKLEAKAKGVNFDRRSSKSVRIPATEAAPAGGIAKAKLQIKEDATREFSVELEGLPVGSYDLFVNDVRRGTINVKADDDGGTEGEIEFTNDPDDDDELPLDFDPVKATLSIRQGGTVLFNGVFKPTSGKGAPKPGSGAEKEIEEALASTGLDPDAKAEAEFSIDADGEVEFDVELENVDVGRYDLFVGGVRRGTIVVKRDREGEVSGEISFEKGGRPDKDDKPDLPLTFDPRGQLIEIKSAAGTFFSHVFGDGSAPKPGGNGTVVVPGEISIALFSTGAAANGTAAAEWERDDGGEESFEVSLRNVPVGTYELLVGGVSRGSIKVTATDRGTRGEIEFENDDDLDGDDLPLGFDPLGQVITVRKDGTVYFERAFPAGS